MKQRPYHLLMKVITREVLTISKTNDLRKLVQELLKEITPLVYYRKADKDALYPHIVHLIDRVNLIAEHRDDVSLLVDIWTKSESSANDLLQSLSAGIIIISTSLLPVPTSPFMVAETP